MVWELEQIVKDLEIYHNITTSGRCTEDLSGNWYGILWTNWNYTRMDFLA